MDQDKSQDKMVFVLVNSADSGLSFFFEEAAFGSVGRERANKLSHPYLGSLGVSIEEV